MLAIQHPTTKLLIWRGITIQLFPLRTQYYVYLIHFHERYKHAGHYLGSTCCLDARLYAHEHGYGARLMEVITEAGIEWSLARLWPCETYEEMRQLERKLKQQHSPVLCPECNPRRGKDVLVELRSGHWPFQLFSRTGKRQPMPR